MTTSNQTYLNPTPYFDFHHKAIQDLVAEFEAENLSHKEKAIGLYNKVRDGWRYDPYHISLSKAKYQSSYIVQKPSGNCVEKSIILIAGLRALGILLSGSP